MSTAKSATASAPSSTANLGSGFDVFGLALDAFTDKVTITRTDKRGVTVVTDGNVPTNPRRNTAGLVALESVKRYVKRGGLGVCVQKNVPVGFGMGSSAASAAAAAVAIDRLLNLKLGASSLVELAGIGERASTSSIHYDNVAASVLGGFVIVRTDPLNIIKMPPPTDMKCCIGIPDIAVPVKKTSASRSLVPNKVSLQNTTANVSNAAAMAAGFARRDTALIGSAMTDAIAEPARQRMIPGLESIRRLCIRAGAVGVAISGAGPSVIAIGSSQTDMDAVGRAMMRGFASAKVRSKIVHCKPTSRGAARL